jgi:predicted ferric reductase
MRWFLQGLFWISLYVVIVLSPLLVLWFGPRPEGREFWREFSVYLGFAGLAMMALQFLLTARLRRAAAPYGIDILYHFHRQVSLVAFLLILAHPVILFVFDPSHLALLNFFEAPWRARFAVLSFLMLVLIIFTSLWRIQLRLNYEVWRILHNVFAILIMVFASLHVVGVGHYVELLWQRNLWLAMTALWVLVYLYIRVWKPFVMYHSPYVLEEVRPEAQNTFTLVMRPEGHDGFRFKPGQFAWITLRKIPFAIREHPFSISSSAREEGRLSFTIKCLGDFTCKITELRPGEHAYIDGPYGSFSHTRHVSDGYVFIAGGVGITPIMSMLRTLADEGDERKLLLFYANERWEDIIFRDELEKLKQRLQLEVIHVLNTPPAGWTGESGFLTVEILQKHLTDEMRQWNYFVCGPDPMMNAVEDALGKLHVHLNHVHSERFNLV